MPIEIRPATAADEPIITQIRRETWLAAYAQIIDPEIIERVTAPRGGASAAPPPDRTSLVAVASAGGRRRRRGRDRRLRVLRPRAERRRGRLRWVRRVRRAAGRAHPAGLAGETGELYALYVAPAHWSTGAGRALTDAALDGLRAAGYRRVVLWTLTENARARRFYDKAGFAPDGATNVLAALGGVEELRYARDL